MRDLTAAYRTIRNSKDAINAMDYLPVAWAQRALGTWALDWAGLGSRIHVATQCGVGFQRSLAGARKRLGP
ncbi:hypothetical protein GCM10023155_16430 [Bremerella cremea]